MNRFVLLGVVCVLIVGGVIVMQWIFTAGEAGNASPSSSSQPEIIQYEIEGQTYNLYTARTADEWAQGLMYYRSLEEVDGMIFYFPEREMRTFWNKNTFMDLDVYWIRDGEVVGTSALPSIENSGDIVTVSSPEAVDVVVEIAKTTP